MANNPEIKIDINTFYNELQESNQPLDKDDKDMINKYTNRVLERYITLINDFISGKIRRPDNTKVNNQSTLDSQHTINYKKRIVDAIKESQNGGTSEQDKSPNDDENIEKLKKIELEFSLPKNIKYKYDDSTSTIKITGDKTTLHELVRLYYSIEKTLDTLPYVFDINPPTNEDDDGARYYTPPDRHHPTGRSRNTKIIVFMLIIKM